MSIKIIKDKEIWDAFVDRSAEGLLFHKWDFLKIVEKHSNLKLFTYAVDKGETTIALIPIFYEKKLGLDLIFSPPPKTAIPYLGFLFDGDFSKLKQHKRENYLRIVCNEVTAEIRKYHPDYFSINVVPSFIDIRYFIWGNYRVKPNFTYIMDLTSPLEDIWNGFSESTRREIRKTKGLGFELSKGSDPHVVFNILKNRYEEQGMKLPILSYEYLADLINKYPEEINIYYLHNSDKEIINGIITVEYKNYISLWFGGLKTGFATTEFMIWRLIQDAKSRNYTKMENIGANTERLRGFKSKFNFRLEISFIISKNNFIGGMAFWLYLKVMKKELFNWM
jgi:hypothetical protein